jgi:iron-sulfur cluster repair protein YtfE (RIC family)
MKVEQAVEPAAGCRRRPLAFPAALAAIEGDLVAHFRAEEEVLFPARRGLPAARDLIAELLAEHRELERIVGQLREAKGGALAEPLSRFAEMLEDHIRKEERSLFPVYEREVSPELTQAVGRGIIERIRTAARPRDPELLK